MDNVGYLHPDILSYAREVDSAENCAYERRVISNRETEPTHFATNDIF